MENTYLFLDKTHQKQVNRIKLPSGVKRTVLNYLENTQMIVKFSIDGENERSADKLSEVHENISEYSPRIILSDSSAYYTQRLYPLVGSFERKLRELLYLSTSGTDCTEAAAIIEKMEEQTLGVLFENLFTDPIFIKNIKDRINGQGQFKGKGGYTKKELQKYLSSLQERSVWNKLFETGQSSFIYDKSIEILKYRNRIMHAYNICKEEYKNAKELFQVAISELADNIKEITKKTEKVENHKYNANAFLLSFSNAMEYTNASILANIIEALGNEYNVAVEALGYAKSSAISNAINRIADMNFADNLALNAVTSLGAFGNIKNSLESFTNNLKIGEVLSDTLMEHGAMQDMLENGVGQLSTSIDTRNLDNKITTPERSDEKG